MCLRTIAVEEEGRRRANLQVFEHLLAPGVGIAKELQERDSSLGAVHIRHPLKGLGHSLARTAPGEAGEEHSQLGACLLEGSLQLFL